MKALTPRIFILFNFVILHKISECLIAKVYLALGKGHISFYTNKLVDWCEITPTNLRIKEFSPNVCLVID